MSKTTTQKQTEETNTQTPQAADAFTETAAAPTAVPKFAKKKRITLDVTNLQKLGQVIACMQSELYEKELPSKFHPSGKAMTTCVDIVNVHTGEEFMLACNTVLASALRRATVGKLVDDGLMTSNTEGGQLVRPISLVGRFFAMRCGEVEAGKRYRRVDVIELEPAQ